MLEFAKELGFTTERHPDDTTVIRVVRDLATPEQLQALESHTANELTELGFDLSTSRSGRAA